MVDLLRLLVNPETERPLWKALHRHLGQLVSSTDVPEFFKIDFHIETDLVGLHLHCTIRCRPLSSISVNFAHTAY